jgi:hypothetical protein
MDGFLLFVVCVIFVVGKRFEHQREDGIEHTRMKPEFQRAEFQD